MIYVKLVLNVLTMNSFSAGLGALYGPLILYMLPLSVHSTVVNAFNPLNAELNPICYLLALLAHHFLHVSRIRVK